MQISNAAYNLKAITLIFAILLLTIVDKLLHQQSITCQTEQQIKD